MDEGEKGVEGDEGDGVDAEECAGCDDGGGCADDGAGVRPVRPRGVGREGLSRPISTQEIRISLTMPSNLASMMS